MQITFVIYMYINGDIQIGNSKNHRPNSTSRPIIRWITNYPERGHSHGDVTVSLN